MSRGFRRFAVFWGAVLVLVSAGSWAWARPNLHPGLVSTWDTKASSVAFASSFGFFDEGYLHSGSYYSNFSSTSGNLSAQFGLHYTSFDDAEAEDFLHGGAGTATFLYSFPLMRRHETGTPLLALGWYAGGAPTVFIQGTRNEVWIPAVTGFSLPWSPSRHLTISPWLEFGVGGYLENVIEPAQIEIDPESYYDPETGELRLSRDDVLDAVSSGVQYEVAMSTSGRAGLHLGIHLSQTFDLNLTAQVSHLGKNFSGPVVRAFGAHFLIHWDDTVPAVLGSAPCPRAEEVGGK